MFMHSGVSGAEQLKWTQGSVFLLGHRAFCLDEDNDEYLSRIMKIVHCDVLLDRKAAFCIPLRLLQSTGISCCTKSHANLCSKQAAYCFYL